MPNRDPQLDSIAAEMFKTFARFEYALKAAGYHRGNGDAVPDWRRFALSINECLEIPSNDVLREAVDYILNHPPKKQVIRNGELNWDEAAPNTDSKSDLVLIYVRRIRNNLFHGGKFNGRWFQPDRSAELLAHSLTILNSCLDASQDVRQAYDN